jgi:hypothetical protein
MLKSSLIVIFFCLFFSQLYSRENPLRGNYTIKVRVKSLDGTPLKNYKIIYHSDTLSTDSSGYVSFKIDWVYYRSVKWYYRRKYNRSLNGKYIYFKGLKGDKYFVKNKWRKYGLKSKGKTYNVDVNSHLYYRF